MNARASVSVDEHVARILAGVRRVETALLPLAECDGMIAATDITALADVPSFDNSSMDGYAVIAADLAGASPSSPVVLEVIADLPAGSADNPALERGQVARIMTGAPMPSTADAIVPLEGTDGGVDRVVITEVHRQGAFIRRAGTDIRHGEVVVTRGTALAPLHLAAVAATGRDAIEVVARPRVGIVSTGSELVAPGEPLERGRIHDSNGTLLSAAVARSGCEVIAVARVADDEDALHATLSDLAGRCDAIILSGGASVGAYDVVKSLFQRHGEVRFDSVRMQPGKPQGFGHWIDGTPVFALPGNPVSVFVSFEVFVRPALDRMRGIDSSETLSVHGTATEGWHAPPGRRQYIPVSVRRSFARGFEELSIRPATPGGSQSHLVASLTRADALAVVDEEIDEVVPGDWVPLLPIPGGASLRTLH